MNASDAYSPVRALGKRPRSSPQCSGTASSSGEETVPSAPKVPTSKRGRGRPPTHGRFVGLGKAQAELAVAKKRAEAEERLADEQALIENAARRVAAERARASEQSADDDVGSMTSTRLQQRLDTALEAIRLVSRQSKGLKGTSQKSLKDSMALIREVMEESLSRTASEEVRRLRAENARLSAEVADLKRLFEERRAEHKKPEASGESELALLVRKELAEFRQTLSIMEGRLLRPPLAADRQIKAVVPPPPQTVSYATKAAASRSTPAEKRPPPPSAAKQTAPKKGKKKGGVAQTPPAPSTSKAKPAAPPTSEGEWETAGKKKAAAKRRRKAAKKAKKAAKQLRTPRSTAVVLTLQPAALERGTTYAELLKKARTAIDPGKLGITAGLRCKTTQTGARLIEVPGATSGEQADRLAADLRKVLPAEDAKVSRPQKCVQVRIAGLDDSIEVEEVATAVARVGECALDQIRCGPIRQGRAGMGTAVVSCPVATAKKLADGRRLLIGWVSAQVRLLEPRPMRCYRCLSSGHVGVKCTSSVDCSGRCFRCGQPGHTAGSCTAAPHCVLCAAAGKPAEHRAGSKGCTASKNSGASPSGTKTAAAASAGKGAEVTMETN